MIMHNFALPFPPAIDPKPEGLFLIMNDDQRAILHNADSNNVARYPGEDEQQTKEE